MSDTVQPDSYIALHYRVANGDDVELVSTFGGGPATMLLGTGELAPPLEQCLIGITPGERHVFLLEPGQAFGAHNPGLVQRIGRADLPPNITPELHGMIEFSSPAGDKFTGVVRELDSETVLVDFNHPLAGKSIRFEVEVLGIM
ncbi:FKBP-type peptidyl-prolyl cis-trans isomerase [Sulfuritalea hydrogenivorans]|jgi:FKBP-type peptidyl-prolyl cis-trans isomerase SlpA|uniref:Peptidyl-prolyl cis-trans isomerase n=1 Tax=Sulfuritalea hydrogenivorans sk43H TaxID=1223802 RepID=W0SCZ6_9PROT|nr:FKBP-type peptidyl-prolyl cis-trans isomerase [Sulfuritalea hydrogenivorans]MDK9715936.1 FKBP-type peptidyl-prolyl cis-trans isomerase [Sulfuritalea sp.]BAO28635.1 FKBP-type peptidyl-prolyl cis-trans isomerase [Sulfuritalea hydrogenivorans sk43H]